MLSQVQDGMEKVIAYTSRTLNKAERNYCVTHRELLAVVYFTHYYRSYLLGRRFLLRTGHGSLTWLRNFKEPERQVARWMERLQEFDLEAQHRQGGSHLNANALSRRPCTQYGHESHTYHPPTPISIFFAFVTLKELLRAQNYAVQKFQEKSARNTF